jgi:hypothetical protein
MRSLLIEFHRFKELTTGILRAGDDYLIAAASYPVRQFVMPLDHRPFLKLMLALRYREGADARTSALKEIGAIVTDMLGTRELKDLQDGEFPLQLDLVVNAAELAALPFEAVTDGEERPLLVRNEQPVELTRRVRQEAFAEIRVRWPARPRILFAWACPPGAGVEVPFKEHGEALRAALKPWLPLQEEADTALDLGDVLTTLPEVSLGALERACHEAVEAGKPFTHIHLLAHGYPIGSGWDERFGIALHAEASGELEAVTPEALKGALEPLRGKTLVVTLATCDSANMINTIAPEKSIAHELHVMGFPVVVASQLPFTVPGSNLMVDRFYGALLAGRDVREALHAARLTLYENRERTGHDWASLVGYVRLHEGYAEHLLDVRLESVLASLKTAQAWSDELVKRGECDPALFDRVAALLRGRIEELEQFLKETEKTGRRGVLEENLGLLGSAEKRLSELALVCSQQGDAHHWQRLMREALQRSRDWYRQGYQHNLSHHWTGTQYLSLAAVMDGKIADPGLWYAAVAAAEIDRQQPKEFWAQGSLVELYLLAPLAGQAPRLEAAAEALEEMKARVNEHSRDDRFPLESTERQLRRYQHWWTNANGFFPGVTDLCAAAAQLLQVL